MKINSQISKKEVLDLLDYDQEFAIFRWKKPWKKIMLGQIAGYKESNGYCYIGINRRKYLLHRLVWLIETGFMPDSEIDHKDRNTRNNKFSNLRLATNSENKQNIGIKKNNTSGFKGVSFHKHSGKFRAQISVDGQAKHLGCFKTAELAHEAYKKASRELHTFSIYS